MPNQYLVNKTVNNLNESSKVKVQLFIKSTHILHKYISGLQFSLCMDCTFVSQHKQTYACNVLVTPLCLTFFLCTRVMQVKASSTECKTLIKHQINYLHTGKFTNVKKITLTIQSDRGSISLRTLDCLFFFVHLCTTSILIPPGSKYFLSIQFARVDLQRLFTSFFKCNRLNKTITICYYLLPQIRFQIPAIVKICQSMLTLAIDNFTFRTYYRSSKLFM